MFSILNLFIFLGSIMNIMMILIISEVSVVLNLGSDFTESYGDS